MYIISNDELAKKPPLMDIQKCRDCGEMHAIKRSLGRSTDLAFIQCDKTHTIFLVGIDGKQL